VTDVARACRLALETDAAAGQAINVGSGQSRTVQEVAQTLARAMGHNDIRLQITGKYRAGDIRHCFADITLARALLGFEPQVPYEEGIAELVEWLREQIATDGVEQATEELSRRGLVA
jgi:dTDP-L-rhamnose 4-epimerase